MCILCVRVKINQRSFEPFCVWTGARLTDRMPELIMPHLRGEIINFLFGNIINQATFSWGYKGIPCCDCTADTWTVRHLARLNRETQKPFAGMYLAYTETFRLEVFERYCSFSVFFFFLFLFSFFFFLFLSLSSFFFFWGGGGSGGWCKAIYKIEDVPLVEFMYLAFTCVPGDSYRKRHRSLLSCFCDVIRALINSLVR